MKTRHTIAIAVLLLSIAGTAAAEHYTILRQAVTLASGPNDDMRPQIVGDVVAISAASVDLDGGVTVPVRNARVELGQQATFVCAVIELPTIRQCELVRAQAVEKPAPDGAVKLW